MFRRTALPDLGAVLLLAACAVLYWKLRIVGTGEQDPHAQLRASLDLYTQIYPNAEAAVRSLRAGELPLWNPYQGCGYPLLAGVLTGVLYPLNFPYLLLPTHLAIEAVVVLHLGLAGLLVYAYARRIRVGRLAAIASGLAFMASPVIAAPASWFPPALAAAVWLPLALVGVEQIVERRSFSGAAWLAAAVSLSLLAGWLQTWTYSMYAVGLYAAVRVLATAFARARPAVLAQILGLLAAGLLLGLGLAAAQLLPSLELQSLTPRRPGGLSQGQLFIYGAAPPAKIFTSAVIPAPVASIYLGILALVLIPLSALAASGRDRTAGLWCIALAGIVLGLTLHTPVYAWFQALPTARWFRVPDRILYLYGFAGSLLLGLGLDAIARVNARGAARRLLLPAVASLCALGLALWAPLPAPALVILAAGVALLWGIAWLPSARLRAGMLAGVVLLLGWDLVHASSSGAARSLLDPGVIDAEREMFEYIREHQQLYRTYANDQNTWLAPPLMHKQGMLREIYAITDYEPLSLERYFRFFAMLEEPAPWNPLQPFTGHMVTGPERPNFGMLDMLSVRYMIVHRLNHPGRTGLRGAGWRAIYAPADRDLLVYENPAPLPRAYAVYDALPAEGEEAAWEALRSGSFDFRRSVVVEANAELRPLRLASRRPLQEAAIVHYEPRRVVVDVTSEAPGYLVLTDTFYPGWKATVDRVDAPILRANFLFRGVPLGPGRHVVTFGYEPTSFTFGAALSLGSLAVLAIGAAASGWRRRRGSAG
jgi:hypothetical protein